MSRRTLAAAVVAASLSSAITAAVLQASLATPAGAAIQPSAGASPGNVAQLQLSQQKLAAQTQRLILAELRSIHKDLRTVVGARLAAANTHLLNLNNRVLNTNTSLAQLVQDNNLLLRDAPSIIGGKRDAQGLIPQIGYILDDFCINAEESHYGQSSAPGLRIGC